MANKLLPQADKYSKKRNSRKRWYTIISVLACVVVFCTTYALILPAITMEQSAYCGIEGHEHGEECYEKQLICGYDEETETTQAVHVHTDACYEESQVLICDKEENEGHVHDESCIQTEQVLICTEEHEHTDECYESEETYVCGMTEGEGAHTHGPECYETQKNLICDIPETEATSAKETHVHTEACYDEIFVCKKEEHKHTLACYSDPEADVESQEVWERSLSSVTLTGVWADDVIAIARSQLGYEESTKNYKVRDDGKTIDGYTRYGDWYGDPYGKWCAMFVSFCLNYAEIPESVIPYESSCSSWIQKLNALYEDASDYSPAKGDIIFFDTDGDGSSDHVGLVESVSDDNTTLQTIEGNSSDKVQRNSYSLSSGQIMGYGVLSKDSDKETSTVDSRTALFSEDEDTEAETASEEGTEDNDKLPVTKISGNDTSYDPKTDLFTTKVRVEFGFINSTAKANTTYTYTYPNGIVIPDDLINKGAQDLYDGETLAGTYQFVKNEDGTYSVNVIFNEDYIQGAGDTVKGYVQFKGSFSKEDMNEKGDIVIDADDATILVPAGAITYPSDETESYNIDVSKAGSWEQDGDKLVYTVYIRTTKGTPKPITFIDKITVPEGITLGEPTVLVEKGTSNYYYASWNNTWNHNDADTWSKVDNITSNYENNQLTFSLPALSAEEKKDSNGADCISGDVYKITYTYLITDQTTANVSVINEVTVSAEDEKKGQTVEDTDDSTVKVDKDLSYKLDKSGEIASDKPGHIKWTITVNGNHMNIADAKLSDEMLGMVSSSSDISISPENGVEVNRDTNDNKITDLTFVEIENGSNKNQYTITYFTPIEERWDGTTVTNQAKLDPNPDKDGDEIEKSTSVTVSGVTLDKSGVYDAATKKITWTITVNSGNLDIAGAKLEDDMFSGLLADGCKIEPESGYHVNQTEDGHISDITFTELKDGKNTQTYTIQYSTDVKDDDPTTNNATLTPGEGKGGKPISASSTVEPGEIQLDKSGTYDWNGHIKWTITVNGSNLDIANAQITDSMLSKLDAGDITVKDASGQVVSMAESEYRIEINEEGKISAIVFLPLDETNVNTKKYVITYSTVALNEWDDRTENNTVKLSLNDKEIKDTETVTVNGSGSITKNAGEGIISEDGNTVTIPWTVTLSIPAGGLAAGTSITDDVTKGQYGNNTYSQWMTYAQICNWKIQMTWMDANGNALESESDFFLPSEQVTFLASDEKDYTYTQIKENANCKTLTYTGFTIALPDGLKPPEGAEKLTFTYSTTADVSQAATWGTSYYNYIKVGNKESSGDYKYYKPAVVKTDGNGTTGTTNIKNEGILTWKIKAYAGQGHRKLTIIDTLPEGVTVDHLQLTGWGNLDMVLTMTEGEISGKDSTDQYSVSGTIDSNTITLDVEPKTQDSNIQAGAEFILTVTCSVNNPENTTDRIFRNNAEIKLDGDSIGSSSQTQEWTYEESVVGTKVVDKSGAWNNDNRIMNYTVILNPEGKDLLPNSDSLTLIDELNYENQVTLYSYGGQTYSIDATLMQSSVKLYKAEKNEDGEWVASEAVNDWSWTYEAKTGEDSWNQHSATNTITATGIPDGTPLLLKYSYRVTSNVPDVIDGRKVEFEAQFNNTAKLEGIEESNTSIGSKAEWKHSSSSAGVSTEKSYTFYKVEAGNYNVSLAGAVFSVYQYDTDNGKYKEEPVKTYSTDDKGSFQIVRMENDADESFQYQTNTLYKVVETEAPKGYKLPDEIKSYYFYFSDSTDETNTLPNELPSDAVDLSLEAKTVYAENVKNITEIKVEKKWLDSDGNDATSSHQGDTITLELYQKAGIGGTSSQDTVTYTASCNYGTITGTFSGVSVGDKVKISVAYTWQASLYDVQPAGWSGVSDGSGEYSNDGWTYDYTCKITSAQISFNTRDQKDSIKEISCSVVESGTTTDSSDPTDEEDTFCGSATIKATDNWTHTFTSLPKTGIDENGNTITYSYFIKEVPLGNYTTTYTNNEGITEGTITVTNQSDNSSDFELPETGGFGTMRYIMGGILLMLASILLYIKQNIKEGRRKHL